MSKWIKNEGVAPYTGESNFEVRLRDKEIVNVLDAVDFGGFDWSLADNLGDIIEWRFTDMNYQSIELAKIYKPKESALSQGEVQQLLHFLRESLARVTIDKNYCNRLAKNLWISCDKEDVSTTSTFEDFSHTNRYFKRYKEKEKNLVNLITKLKGL